MEENRHLCYDNDNNDCKYTPQGINAAFGYNTVSTLMDDLNCNCENDTNECWQNRKEIREKMLKQIKFILQLKR